MPGNIFSVSVLVETETEKCGFGQFLIVMKNHMLFVKAREQTCEQEALQSNAQLHQEISGLRAKVEHLEVELSSARIEHSQQAKVPVFCVVCNYLNYHLLSYDFVWHHRNMSVSVLMLRSPFDVILRSACQCCLEIKKQQI